MTPRDRDGGFSLTEAVAALAVTALFVLLMSGMSGLVAKNWEATARKADAVEQLAAGLSAMRRDISAAMWLEVGAGSAKSVLFAGERSRIAFVVSGQPDMLVSFHAVPVPGGSAIMRSSSVLAPGARDFAGNWSAPQEVLRGPWRFDFAFAQRRAGLEWATEWPPGRGSLPAAVKLRLSSIGSEAAPIVDFVVPVRGTSPPPCRNDGCASRAAQMAAME